LEGIAFLSKNFAIKNSHEPIQGFVGVFLGVAFRVAEGVTPYKMGTFRGVTNHDCHTESEKARRENKGSFRERAVSEAD